MAIALAGLEGALLLTVVCGAMALWPGEGLAGWRDVGIVVVKAAVLVLCCGVSFYYNDLYDLRRVRGFGEFASRLLQSFGAAFVLLAGVYAAFPDANVPTGPFAVSFLVMAGLLLPVRAVSYGMVRRRGVGQRVLIVGTTPLARKVAGQIEECPHPRYAFLGFVDVAAHAERNGDDPYPVFGPLERIEKIIEELHPDRIVVALSERRNRLPVRALLDARLQGIAVEDGIDVCERLAGKLAIESLTPSALIFSRDFGRSTWTQALQRALSLAAAVVALALTAPLLALIALLIKLDSRGPVFFVQPRAGSHGRRFNLIKFRTMHPARTTSEWAQDNGDRITRVGRWLRHFRLDELPQFLNILRGHMNLVGPRPHPTSNFELFSEHIPYYVVRSSIRPGLTGWAQVRYGYANNLDEEIEKMRYDLYYIKHLSLWLDLRILVETVKIVLFGRGARAADVYPTERLAEAMKR